MTEKEINYSFKVEKALELKSDECKTIFLIEDEEGVEYAKKVFKENPEVFDSLKVGSKIVFNKNK